jgi:hypothetical protein
MSFILQPDRKAAEAAAPRNECALKILLCCHLSDFICLKICVNSLNKLCDYFEETEGEYE